MSADLTASVEGVEVTIRRLMGAGDAARERLTKKVKRLGLELLTLIKIEYLRGPRPERLARKTGRLSRELNEKTTSTSTEITSAVGTNLFYGALWERGFDRRVGPGSRGGTIRKTGHGSRAAQMVGTKHYQRMFLRPALAQMRDRIIAELSKGIVTDGG